MGQFENILHAVGRETPVSHPAGMTHSSIPKEDRVRRGIDDGLVRLSVGIENKEDLEDGMVNALSSI